jgi:hypothetical protein
VHFPHRRGPRDVPADYKTRIVVLRPINPSDFSGTVFVEWFKVSGNVDRAAIWITGHTGITLEGHAWVGVSAQLGGIEGEDGATTPFSLKSIDPDRYGSLVHPGDSFSYDIFSQVSEAIRNPQTINVLEGLPVKQVVATVISPSTRPALQCFENVFAVRR